MEYVKYPPKEVLKPFVECYFNWRGIAKEELDVQTPPNSFGAIVFNYGDPYRSYQHSRDQLEPVPRSFACGLFTSNYHLLLKGNIEMFGVVVRPATLHNILGLHMSKMVNSRVSLDLLLGEKANQLFSELHNIRTDMEKVNYLHSYLASWVPVAISRLSIVDEAIELIDSRKGVVAVDEVADELRVSRRYLEKKFLEKVGVSPKFYARIKRFVELSKQVAYGKDWDWQEIISNFGFHDQSHLVKEFLLFNNMNPTDYFQNHKELIRFVKK